MNLNLTRFFYCSIQANFREDCEEISPPRDKHKCMQKACNLIELQPKIKRNDYYYIYFIKGHGSCCWEKFFPIIVK